jgi:carboxyl-terminal processing protease
MQKLKAHGRFIVAAIALALAFVLSVQFSDRGVQFDLRNSTLSASPSGEATYDLAKLKILNRVLLQIKDNYVEPDRIDPNRMLVYALDEIQNSIAEVVVDFDADKDDHPKRVTVSVNQKKKDFDIDEIESLWEMSYRLKEIFAFVQEHLDGETEVEYRDVEYAAINGMLTTLDPHSTLLPPQNYEEMQTQTGGKFGGLGIVISVRDGKLTVISPIDGTPAARKGIKSRDHIVRIGEESTINMNLNEAVNMLRGEPGTDVELWIERKGWSEPRKFVVTRAEIKIDSVESEPLANKVGYVRIKNFQANTYPDLKKQLGELKEKMGGMRGLVLDMRDNPGGLLDQAIKVSDLFLREGTIVSTVGVGNRLREKRAAKVANTEPTYPIVVLVNAGSASASEIVSGALQNHDRAIVVGDTTFGKGSVQILYEFPDDSALKLTVAQYLTPGGISIQSSGITPDIRTIPVLVTEDEVDLFLSQNILREQDLDSHLTNKAVKSKRSAGSYFVRYLQEPPSDDEEFDDDSFEEDFEIRFAQRLVSNAGKTFDRAKLLEKLEPEIEGASKTEFATIRKELKRYGVDWSEGPTVKKASLDVKVEMSPDGSLEAGNKLEISVTATNRGTKPIHQLKAISDSESDILDDREFLFGKLAPGESKTWKADITVPKDAPSRRDVVKFDFSDANTTFTSEQKTAEVTILGADRPQFAFSYSIDDTSGDGILSGGETAKLDVVVKNIGNAASDETLVFLKSLTRESVYLKRGRSTLESIPAGEEMAVEFEFDVKDPPKEGDKVKLEVDIYDSTFRQYTRKTFEVPFSKEKKVAKDAAGLVEVKNPKTALYASAVNLGDRAGLADKGTRLKRIATVDDFTVIDLRGRRAFVPTKFVTDVTDGEPNLAGLSRTVMFQPPSINVSPSKMLTTQGNILLDGSATDDSSVKDYYIFVYNRDESKLKTRKLEYVKVDGDTIKISTKVPLFPGMNRIAVVARDDDGMSTSESAYVYRK